MSKPSVSLGAGAIAIVAVVTGFKFWDAPGEYERDLAARPPVDRAREKADFEAYQKRMGEYVAPEKAPAPTEVTPVGPPTVVANPASRPPAVAATTPPPAQKPAVERAASDQSAITPPPAPEAAPTPATPSTTPAVAAVTPPADAPKLASAPVEDVKLVVQSTKTVNDGGEAYTVETVIERRQPSLRERMERKSFTLRNVAGAN